MTIIQVVLSPLVAPVVGIEVATIVADADGPGDGLMASNGVAITDGVVDTTADRIWDMLELNVDNRLVESLHVCNEPLHACSVSLS